MQLPSQCHWPVLDTITFGEFAPTLKGLKSVDPTLDTDDDVKNMDKENVAQLLNVLLIPRNSTKNLGKALITLIPKRSGP